MKASRLVVTLCTAVLFTLPAITQAQQKVRIIKLPDKNVVYPPAVVVVRGDTIVFKAVNVDAEISLPESLLPGGEKGFTLKIKEGDSKVFRVPRDAKPGVYQYRVVCGPERKTAQGFSGPIIIIE